MKRLLLALGLMLTCMLSFGAQSAKAYTYNCFYINSGQGWPNGGYAKYCGSAAELAQLKTDYGYMTQGLSATAQAAYAYSAVVNANAKFYLFKNPADATAYYKERNQTPPTFTAAFGQTPVGAQTGKPTGISYIFEYDPSGNHDPDIQLFTDHEFGHWSDYYVGQKLGLGLLSSTALWDNLVIADFDNLNQHNQGSGVVNYPCSKNGGNGVFTHRQGSILSQEFICDGQDGSTGTKSDGYGTALNTGYSGTNQTVLENAWNAIYGQNKEIFAEEFVVFNTQYNDLYQNSLSADAYLFGTLSTQKFACTQIYMQSVSQQGVIPTAQLAGAGCPTK